ncbi:MAG: hypothetical protein U5O15_00380 [Candidatus Krumholzibacteriota bacterium]|nr:hypothetical protein [Candidatus Krumholzibacteriota bacterium]
MNEKLNLTLDRGKREKGVNARLVYFLLIAAVLFAGINLALFLSGSGGTFSGGNNLSADRLEELALKLERQNLLQPAARTWKEYLALSGADREERASVWYRIGKIYQRDDDYKRALEAYYHSEMFGSFDFKSELSRRTTECLERLGMFAALNDELREKTSVSQSAEKEKEVVAEIGNWKITKTKMESLIENEVEAVLSGVGPGLSEEQKNKQKEEMLSSVLEGKNRMQWLRSYIAEELIYRRAMEEKLYEDPEYKEMSRRNERRLLVRKYLSRKYSSEISIGEEDLRDYYEDHREEFVDDEGGRRSFDQSRQEVYSKVRAREEGDVQRELIEELMNKYDAVIHNSKMDSSE